MNQWQWRFHLLIGWLFVAESAQWYDVRHSPATAAATAHNGGDGDHRSPHPETALATESPAGAGQCGGCGSYVRGPTGQTQQHQYATDVSR